MAVKDLVIRMLVDDTDLSKINSSAETLGSKVKTGLNQASVAAAGVLGGLAAVGAGAVEDLKRIETINAQTAAVIESTGGAAGVSADHIADLSGKLEGLTATEGEAIQEGANLLLTFTNIKNGVGEGNDIFDQATTSLVDMARAMGTDPQSAAVQLGKALNDPIAGISALSRVGIQFTDDQKAMIESLVESGDTMGAQKIILEELNTQFGGSGESYAGTLAGQQELFGHKIGETTEAIAAGLMPIMSDFLENVALPFATWASENPELLGVLVGVIGGVAGGILVLNGVMSALPAIQEVATAAQWLWNAAMSANPVMLVVTAIGALVAGLAWFFTQTEVGRVAWGEFTRFLGETWDNFTTGFGIAIEGITNWWNGLMGDIGNGFEGLGNGLVEIGHGIATAFAWLWNNTIGAISIDIPGAFGMPGIKFDVPDIVIPALATGGIVTSPTLALIGEAGPEAVVPLSQGSAYGLGPSSGRMEADVPIVVQIDGNTLLRIIKRITLRAAY